MGANALGEHGATIKGIAPMGRSYRVVATG